MNKLTSLTIEKELQYRQKAQCGQACMGKIVDVTGTKEIAG